MLIVSISLMNLVTALMVDNAMSQSVQDKEAEQAWEAASKKKAIPKLKEMFLDLDEDGSGCLELEELQNAPEDLKDQLRQIAKMEDCEELFHSLDYDGSGSIDVEEFCDGVLKASQENKPLELLRLARQCTAIHQSTKEALQLIQESWPEGSQGDKADFPAAPRPDAAAAVLDEGGRPRAAEASLGARVTSMELRIAGMESTLQNIADVLAAAAAAVRRPDRPAARAERRPDAPAPRGSAAAQLERAARAAAEAETAAKVAAEKQRRECIFASLRQQVLCCSQFSIGCPNGSRGEGPPFDCDLHAADPTRLWSPAKKEWCCLHVGRACAGDAAVAAPAEASCDLAGGASPSEWPAGRREHCCRTAGVGCARGAAAAATELDFDCEAGHSKWATGWSAEKKAFCCEREQKGCEGPMRTSTTTTASTPALPSNALGMGSTFATGAAAGRRGVIGAAAANAATKPSTTALPAAAAMNGTSSAAATKRRRPAIGVAAASTATDAASAAAPATSATSATTLRATTASRTTTTAATATTSTGEAPRPRTVARTTAAAPRGPAPAPVPPAAPGGRRLSFADVEFSNLGGQGPDGAGASSGRRGIRYRSVTQVGGRGVDLVLDAIGGYAPAAWDVGANGRRGSLGMVTFSCGTRADLGLGLFEAGTNRSAVVPNFYLSLVHVRHSGLARRGEVSVKGPSNWYLSASTRAGLRPRCSLRFAPSDAAEAKLHWRALVQK
ncbi:unnamed protein product, partial [Prorocentrum cordatum]